MNYSEKAELAVSLSEKILEKLWQYDFEPSIFQAALGLSWAQSVLMENIKTEDFKKMSQDLILYFEDCRKLFDEIDRQSFS